MRIFLAVIALIALATRVHAECLFDETEDLKLRATTQIRKIFSKTCIGYDPSSLDFRYFGTWENGEGDIVVHQTFYVTEKGSDGCVRKIVAALKRDARAGKAPTCSVFKPYKAAWYPDADSGPSILFYLRRTQ